MWQHWPGTVRPPPLPLAEPLCTPWCCGHRCMANKHVCCAHVNMRWPCCVPHRSHQYSTRPPSQGLAGLRTAYVAGAASGVTGASVAPAVVGEWQGHWCHWCRCHWCRHTLCRQPVPYMVPISPHGMHGSSMQARPGAHPQRGSSSSRRHSAGAPEWVGRHSVGAPQWVGRHSAGVPEWVGRHSAGVTQPPRP